MLIFVLLVYKSVDPSEFYIKHGSTSSIEYVYGHCFYNPMKQQIYVFNPYNFISGNP